MNSLKRHNKANKPKDAIIMTKYNIVKIFRRSCRQKNQVYGNAIPLWMRTKIPGSVWPTGQQAGRMLRVLRRGCIAMSGPIPVYLCYKRG